ncbi:MAG: hypothetical protein ABJZ55_06265 [Fuerstiella sp.]
MMSRSPLALSTLFGCLAFLPVGCGSESSPSAAEDSVKAIMSGMEDGRPVVAWEALPESYQADVNELVQSFGTNMDADAWAQITGLIGNVHQTLASKQEFLLNYPAILNSEDPAVAQATVKQSTKFLKTLLDSVQDLEKLKSFDGKTFMESSGKDMAAQIVALQGMVKNTPGMQLQMSMSEVKVETLESTSTTAKLKLTSPDGKDEEVIEMVQKEGKWLPKKMVDGWDEGITKAREAMAQLPEQADAMKGQMMMVSAMATGILSPLQAAEDQEQFNKAVDGMQSSIGGMMGGMMGGMGAPGGGSGLGGPSSGSAQ